MPTHRVCLLRCSPSSFQYFQFHFSHRPTGRCRCCGKTLGTAYLARLLPSATLDTLDNDLLNRCAQSVRFVSRRRWAGAARKSKRKVRDPSSRPAKIPCESSSPPAVSAELDARGNKFPAEIRRRIRHRTVPSAGVIETASLLRQAGGERVRSSRKSSKCHTHRQWRLVYSNVRARDEGRQALR